MSVEDFFTLLLDELKTTEALRSYYKFHADPDRLLFRKAYFCQRLDYIIRKLGDDRSQRIWDCGCGYGTTAIFLALNGFAVEGTTLEFYLPVLQKRIDYWSQHGNVSRFRYRHEDLFDARDKNVFDTILLQDTLHHVEPVGKGLQILRAALKKSGRLLVVEENGANLLQNLKLLQQRGFKKTTNYFDEKLQRSVMMGNENIRSLQQWKRLFAAAGLVIDEESVEHVRLLPPPLVRHSSVELLVQSEKGIADRFPFLKKHFFFAINFTARKA